MRDFPQNSSKTRQSLNQEAFARFMESLSPDAEEAGRLYMRLLKKLEDFFSLKGISDPVSAANETIDRAAMKIMGGVPVPDVGRYCLGIARNICKERYRSERLESSAFLKFIENLPDAYDEYVERINAVLKPCFEQLAMEDQQLLMAYCQVARGRARAEHRRQMAETMKTTVLALRMRVTRLRSALADCVKNLSQVV